MRDERPRAVQYTRMSTDMQEHSIANQSAAIETYAERKGLKIVRKYEDAGRSGLTLTNRPALRQLLHEVHSATRDFEIILVHDVSRWGRFQDTDESAYYEFVCRNAGVRIEYCAEAFENDGSLTSAVLKSIKRAMAGEFSRELSAKVFAGQSRVVSQGFHCGSTPGYGLRRYLIDSAGQPKLQLEFGEHKNVHTERVILVPGPQDEVRVVRLVYNLFTERNETIKQIAVHLNANGHTTVAGRPWSSMSVRELLTNEKYIGNSVYNRTSKKLGRRWERNPKAQWIRSIGAFEPIVSLEQFAKAQRRISRIKQRNIYSETDLLNSLTALWCCKGRLTNLIIERSRFCPSNHTYKSRFKSLANALSRIGYPPSKNTGFNLNLRKSVCDTICKEVVRSGGTATRLEGSCQLQINNELVVSVVVGRSHVNQRQNLWQFGYRSRRRPDILVVIRMDARGAIIDYYLLPYTFLARGAWLTASGRNYARLEPFRTTNLEPLVELLSRVLMEASQ